jgi:uncharacterized OB-fold protein
MSTAGSRTSDLTVVIDGRHHLAGSRCEACGTVTFPTQSACPRCGGTTSTLALPTEGTVWSWTVQRIAPKPPYVGPDPFVPFALGYVDLGPVRVESPLAGRPVESWRIGTPVSLVVGTDDDGSSRTFRFVPAGAAGAVG